MKNINIVTKDGNLPPSTSLVLENICNFLQTVDVYEILKSESQTAYIEKNKGVLTMKLRKQGLQQDVIETLNKVTQLNILSSITEQNNAYSNIILFTKPYKDEMYVINITSYMYSLVEELIVTFYSSMEIMFAELQECLTNVVRTQNDKAEIISIPKLYSLFM